MNALAVFLFLFVQACFCRGEQISLRLVGGRETHEGNVMVKRGSDWGLVCDDEWDIEDGNVVCRQLGYEKATQVTTYNKYFSSIQEKIFLDDVKCQGHESNLGECMHREWMTSNCNAGEAAGVICAVTAVVEPQLEVLTEQNEEPVATTSSLRIDIETDRNPVRSRVEPASGQAAIDIESHVGDYASTSTESQIPVAQRGYSERTRELLARVRELLNPAQPTASQPEVPVEHNVEPYGDMGNAFADWDITSTHARPDTLDLSDDAAALTGVSGYFNVDEQSQQAVIVPREITDDEMQKVEEEIREMKMKSDQPLKPAARPYRVEVVGGRRSNEGYVKVTLDNGKAGAICSDNWGIYEAMVVCRQSGKQQAEKATLIDYYGARSEDKVIYEVNCDGHERSLADCEYKLSDRHGVKCSKPMNVAGVVCTSAKLPDLMPNLWALQSSLRIEEKPLHSLTCAMEENCLSSSAHTASYGSNSFGYNSLFGGFSSGPTRRLLRFSSSIFNNGTADFRPRQHRSGWEWHSCHQHYHSMSAFSHYDILDSHGNRVAEGHKASFCLEDVECNWPHTKKYSCRGFADQGISIGCADVYRSDIDCQWIDITDIQPGAYVFKLNVNPQLEVAELSFDNNAAVCELSYNGYSAKLSNCVLARG